MKKKLFTSLCFLALVVCCQPVVAQGLVDFSYLGKYIPDSLKSLYPKPMLANDDVIFGLDSTGGSLFANFAQRDGFGRIIVVNPNYKGDSGLVWMSEELPGQFEHMFAQDINGDGYEELVATARKMGDSGWSRLYMWRWEGKSGTMLHPCDDSTGYFESGLRTYLLDYDHDGIWEVTYTPKPATNLPKTVLTWGERGYCKSSKNYNLNQREDSDDEH